MRPTIRATTEPEGAGEAHRPTETNALLRTVGRSSIATYRLATRCRDKAVSLLWAGAFAGFGRRSVIQLPVRIRGERRIRIGSNVFVGAGSWLQVEGDESGDVVLEIGDGTSIVGGCVISAAEFVRLGRDVLLARNIYVSDHMHAFANLEEPILAQGIDRTARVEIDDGAWLGQNVVVGPGVRIGRGAVVGANSVVLTDIPDYSVAVGAPARVIRTLAGADASITP